MEKTEVLGIGFNRVTMDEALAQVDSYVAKEQPHLIVTANPETVMIARGDQLFAEILAKASLVVADGIGVVWASGVIGKKVPERIPGIELAEGMLERASTEGWRVYLLGGEEGVAEKAAAEVVKRFPGLNVVGTHHGFFQSKFTEQFVIAQIKQQKPHLLLVALGVPRQEKWLAAHLGVLQVPVAVGVGGSFNVWAGVDKRAPKWLQKVHLEWLYRLVKQPWRIRRMAVLPKFVGAVVLTRLGIRR